MSEKVFVAIRMLEAHMIDLKFSRGQITREEWETGLDGAVAKLQAFPQNETARGYS